jgi:hypothetical protein
MCAWRPEGGRGLPIIEKTPEKRLIKSIAGTEISRFITPNTIIKILSVQKPVFRGYLKI